MINYPHPEPEINEIAAEPYLELLGGKLIR